MNKKLIALVVSLLTIQGTWAAVPAVTTLQWEVESGGSNTANAGCADQLTSLAGRPTDATATSGNTTTPVVSSASYNFVAGDVNAWLFIASGTNWIAGWYKITSVAANAATVDAAIGHATLTTGGLNTVAGVATVASPTSGTWGVDYTRRTTGQFTGSDLIANTATTVHTTSSHSFTKADVGNCIVVSGGASCTAGTFELTAVAAGVATLDSSIGASCTGATYAEGGALAAPTYMVTLSPAASNLIWMQGPSISMPSNTAFQGNQEKYEGYGTVRTDGTAVTLTLSDNAGITNSLGQYTQLRHIIFNCNSQSSDGLLINNNNQLVFDLVVKNCNNTVSLTLSGPATCIQCYVTNGTNTNAGINMTFGNSAPTCIVCWVVGNAGNNGAGIRSSASWCFQCGAINGSGTTVNGILIDGGPSNIINGTAYGNTGDGIHINTSLTQPIVITNTISSNNSGWGVNLAGAPTNSPVVFDYNAYGNNTSGNLTAALHAGSHDVTLTVDPFVSCASSNCALNSTAGGGKAVKGNGYPGVTQGGTGVQDMGALQSGTGAQTTTVTFGVAH